MNKTTKAVLLSAFIYPGLGHFYQKKYLRALMLTGTTTIVLYFLLSNIVKKANLVAEKVLSSDTQTNLAAITKQINQHTTGNEFLLLNIATVVLILLWVAGIVDSCRTENSN